MPEGPETWRAADRIAEALVGRTASRVFLAFARLKRFEPLLAGEPVAAVEPRGKALLVRFANGLALYSHSQLYGRWFVRPAGETPRTGRSLRAAVHNGERSALLYSASEVDVLDDAAIEAHAFLGRIGPDVLAPETTPARLARRLADRRFRGRQLGALLLDQDLAAGLGNYLRSEVLHVAGLAPETRPAELDAPGRARLARAMRSVARRAYRSGGVTLDRAGARALRGESGRRRARHFVFGRAGRPCIGCGAPVRRREVAGRRLYDCPRCQPRAAGR